MRKNVAGQSVSLHLVSATDGSDVTAGSPSVFVTKDAGVQAAGTGTIESEGNGEWSYQPTQAETNANHVAFTIVLAGAISNTVNVYPVAYDPTNGTSLGVSRIDAAITSRATAGDAMTLTAGERTATAAAIEAAIINDGDATAVLQAIADKIAGDLTVGDISTQAIASAVWAAASRVITGMTTAAKNEVNAEVDIALADYDGPTKAEMDTAIAGLDTKVTTIDGIVNQILLDTGTDGVVLSTATQDAIATSLLTLTDGVESGLTVKHALQACFSALAGILAGADSDTVTTRDLANTKNRITFTTDATGNRTGIAFLFD